jgi:hypothetical protein
MNPIPRSHIPLFADRIRMLGELQLSADRMMELFHGYQQYLIQRTMLEQMATGGRSNADFAKWADTIVKQDDDARRGMTLRNPRRLTILRTPGVP